MLARTPLLLETKEAVNNEGAHTFSVPVRYAKDDCAVHLVGTLDERTSGSTGVERAYDALLTMQGGTYDWAHMPYVPREVTYDWNNVIGIAKLTSDASTRLTRRKSRSSRPPRSRTSTSR